MPQPMAHFDAKHHKRLRALALLPCHYLVRVYAPDKKTLVGMLVFRISPATATDQAEAATREFYNYMGASRRRPLMDVLIKGYDWREYGRKRALEQAKVRAIRQGRAWLFPAGEADS